MYQTASGKTPFRFLYFIASALTLLALSADLNPPESGESLLSVIESFQSVHITDIILFLFLLYFYRHALTVYKTSFLSVRAKLCCHIPAALFAVFMILGHSFYADNSWNLVFESGMQLLKSCIALSGWYALFFCCTVCLFDFADRLPFMHFEKKQVPYVIRRYLGALETHPFRTCFLTLLIACLPYMVLSYPAIFTHDTRTQLVNMYQGLKETATLRNQHPIVHSLTMYFFTELGRILFSSMNTGMFLYALFQLLLLVAAMSWTVKLLMELKAPCRAVIPLMLLFLLSPTTQNYMFTCIKDVPFCAFLMVFLVQLFRIVTGRCGENRQRVFHQILLTVSALGMFFFRQDGIYQLLITFLVLPAANRKSRKLWRNMGIVFLCLFIVWNNVLLPAFQVRPSSRREMLSIPFQQTARYIRDAGDQVTKEEAEAISAILDYENLGELYNPNLSDQVKGTFNDDATGEDLAAYFRAWFQMLLKHPDIYVQATMNNIYGYFYPDGYLNSVNSYAESEEHMEKLNESLETYGADFHYPSFLQSIRNTYETFRDALFSLPALSLLRMPAFYVWGLLLWAFYCLARRKRDSLSVATPLLVALLVCIAGPAYGWYFRYLFAISLCLPCVILTGLYISSGQKTDGQI